MTDREILKQLKILKAITPSTNWKLKQKRFLLSKTTEQEVVALSTRTVTQDIKEIYSMFSKNFRHAFQQIPTVPVAIFSIMLLIFGAVSVNASLPGDSLYVIKRGFEEGRLALAFNPESKLKLQMSLLEKRISELQTISQRDHFIRSDINEPVRALRNNIENIEHSIPLVFKTQQDRLLSMADYIDKKSNDYQDSLGKLEHNVGQPRKTMPIVKKIASNQASLADVAKQHDTTLEKRFKALSNSLNDTKARVTLLIQKIEEKDNTKSEVKDVSEQVKSDDVDNSSNPDAEKNKDETPVSDSNIDDKNTNKDENKKEDSKELDIAQEISVKDASEIEEQVQIVISEDDIDSMKDDIKSNDEKTDINTEEKVNPISESIK